MDWLANFFMNIQYGKGSTKYGPGVSVELTGDEVAIAIDAWLVAHGVHVRGPRTITVNGELCERGQIYVDPSGFVITPDGRKMSGGRRVITERLDPPIPTTAFDWIAYFDGEEEGPRGFGNTKEAAEADLVANNEIRDARSAFSVSSG